MRFMIKREGCVYGPYAREEVLEYIDEGYIVPRDRIGSLELPWMPVKRWQAGPAGSPGTVGSRESPKSAASDSPNPLELPPQSSVQGHVYATAGTAPDSAPVQGTPSHPGQPGPMSALDGRVGPEKRKRSAMWYLLPALVLMVISAASIYYFLEHLPESAQYPSGNYVPAVSVSDSLPPSGGLSYGPANLMDGDPRTAWKTDRGVNSWMEIKLEQSGYVRRIAVQNGHQWLDHPTRGNLWEKNSRIRTANLYVNNAWHSTMNFQAGYERIEYFPVNEKDVRTIRIEVDSMERGRRSEELAVSEISVE